MEDYSSYLLFESKELRIKVAVFFQSWEMHPVMSPWKKGKCCTKVFPFSSMAKALFVSICFCRETPVKRGI